MNLLHQVFTSIQFLCFLITFTYSTNNHLTADVSINCGSSGTFAARDGREWVGDVINPKYSSLLQVKGSSTTSTVKNKLIFADPIPHKTARVSRSQFSYSFQVSPGQKTLRLHFSPSSYKGFKGLKDLFTVEAGAFTLLGNFSASLTANALGVSSISKEFYLNIQENEQLNITFSPQTSNSWDTYAFINGIEIISVPTRLSLFQGGDVGVQVVGQKSLVYVDHHTALELIHRLNIKHSSVQSSRDFNDASPMWALRKADKVKNKTWKIPVDVGFKYMIRLYFSEMGLKIAKTDEVVFKVLINGMIAQTSIDLVKERDDESNIPRYRDYTVMMRGHRKEGKHDLSISVHSYDDLIDGKGLVAGFEIFKLSNPDNSLASLNPLPLAHGSPSKTILIFFSVLSHGNVISTVAITIGSLVCVIVHMCLEYWEANNTEEENKPSARAERLCRRFSLVEIQLATRDFSDGNLIGRGGFGKVYKGLIDRGRTTVAVKRLKPNSMQGPHEFLMEIETLSELRHVNLVSLIGYCNERREMILVYDYMSGGTLSDHLNRFQRESNNNSSLTWKQRLNICIGAGRGLDYLHTGHGVIHRDVKTSNILLDENLVAKVSDFGLAKHEDRSKFQQSHVSTNVKGTKGYLDPHYLHTRKLTRKTDTYAFGVVLFEILCGRPAVDLSVAEDEHILTKWARDNINKGEVDQILASSLREEMSPASLNTFVGIAERCLHDEPMNRPTMSQVVQQLEIALDQHDNKQVLLLSNERTSASDDIRPSNNDKYKSISTEQKHSEAVNFGLPSVTRKNATIKPLRLWPWAAFWNRVVPSKKNYLLSETGNEANIISTICERDMISANTNVDKGFTTKDHLPDMLILILVCEILANLIPNTQGLNSDKAASCVKTKCLKKVEDCATKTFLEFENLITSNDSATVISGGRVHPLTRYVMNYINTLMEFYRITIIENLKDHDAEDSLSGSLMSKHFRSLLSSLEHNLNGNLNLCKDESLRHFFLMNNLHYMAEKVNKSELKVVLGADWIRKHYWKSQQHATKYERATWSSMLNLFRDEGEQSKTVVNERLQSFNIAFEEVHKTQTGWLIPDGQLRDDLRISISGMVIPAYCSFIGRYDRIITNHVKYTADDLQECIFDLFEGSQKSLQ